jgi:osmotically-inducible protein OsmY
MLPVDESNGHREAVQAGTPARLAERTEARLRASARLRGNAQLSLMDISCECLDGVLVLRGRVPSYYLKQLAGAIVAEVEGVQRIDNRLEIVGAAVYRPGGPAAQPTEGGQR